MLVHTKLVHSDIKFAICHVSDTQWTHSFRIICKLQTDWI